LPSQLREIRQLVTMLVMKAMMTLNLLDIAVVTEGTAIDKNVLDLC